MNQPVSNNSFKPRHGYLGVFLHEGGPLTDALWNESSDVQLELARWLALDAGLAGTAGPELEVKTAPDSKGSLVIRGGPGRFYCNGLPVLWPADRRINVPVKHPSPVISDRDRVELQHGSREALPDEGREHIEWEKTRLYYVYLDAWVDTVDSLDRSFLDDPGIACEPGRGSFRKVVRSYVRIAADRMPELEHTNLELTVQGTYRSDQNVHYAIELVSLSKARDYVQLLWDDAGGAVVSEVTRTADRDSHSVELKSTRGFAVGQRVRFDGRGISNTIYRITAVDGGRITIHRDASGEALRSLADCEVVTWKKTSVSDAQGREKDIFELTVGPVPPTEDGAIKEHQLVIGAPRMLDVPGIDAAQLVWRVAKVEDENRRISLTLDGLAETLDPWDTALAVELEDQAHPFSYCVVVADHPDWTEGMRVQISATPPEEKVPGDKSPAGTKSDDEPCLPGQGRIQSSESRTITKIVRCRRPIQGGQAKAKEETEAVMIVRLDEPLSYEHAIGCKVTPARVIRAQRFAGYEYRVPIGSVSKCHEGGDGPCCLTDPPKLPSGLELFLTRPFTGDEATVVPGDGWRFAARGSGQVDRPVFAPVEPRHRCYTPLASFWQELDGDITLHQDLRPLPRGCQEDVCRSRIRHACLVIAQRLPKEEIGKVARDIHGALEQQRLVPLLSRLKALCGKAPDEALDPAAHAARALPTAIQEARSNPSAANLEAVAAAVTSLSETIRPAVTPAPPRPPRPGPPRPGPGKKSGRAGSDAGAGDEEAGGTDGGEGEPQDLGAIPLTALRVMDEIKSDTSRDRLIERWPTVADCLRNREPPRGRQQERILAVVQELAQQTAAITSRIGQAGESEDSLRAELEALWDEEVRLEALGHALSLENASRFADDWARTRGES